jgi:hypothetical protein
MITKTTSMKRERAWGRVEKQSKPACGLRALTPNRQSVVSFEKLCGFARFSPQPGTAPQHQVVKKRSEGEPEAANSGSCPNIDFATDPKVPLTAVVIW